MENRTIEQIAADFAGDRSLGAGHGYPNFTADMLAKGFREGYKKAVGQILKIKVKQITE